MTAALLLAAPAIVIMLIIDLSFGLVNRYAPSLNVFALTLPIKAWLSTAVILLMIGALMDFVLQRLGDSRGFLDVLQKAFSARSEEHTSELQSLMRISYAVFCLKKKKHTTNKNMQTNTAHI